MAAPLLEEPIVSVEPRSPEAKKRGVSSGGTPFGLRPPCVPPLLPSLILIDALSHLDRRAAAAADAAEELCMARGGRQLNVRRIFIRQFQNELLPSLQNFGFVLHS